MVELVKHRNFNKEYTRPSIEIPRSVWRKFCFYYPNKECRNDIICKLIDRQLEEHVVAPEEGFADSIADQKGVTLEEMEQKREIKGDYPINFLL
ncbi:MAG: hypothetical protein ACOCQD_00080 [archaeon]